MKKLIILSLLCGQSFHYFSQTDSLFRKNRNEIDVNYNWSHIGRNLNINYIHSFGRHAIIIGLKKHYNSVITDSHVYYKNKGHATNLKESIGLNIGYRYDLLKKHDYLMPYLFFQSQISNIRFKRMYEYSEIRDNVLVYHTDFEISEPLFVTENYMGFGLKVRLHKNLFLNQTIGGGIATFKGEDTKGTLFTKPINANIEFSHSIKIGLIYQFK